MNENNKSFKTAHVLLGIPAIITCLLLVVLLIFNIYLVFTAGQDPNGGGWIIFYQMIFGIVFFPLLALAIAHCLTCLISFLKRQKNRKSSRTLGITSSILGIITMFFVLPITLIFILDGIAVLLLLLITLLELLSIGLLIAAMALFIKNKEYTPTIPFLNGSLNP